MQRKLTCLAGLTLNEWLLLCQLVPFALCMSGILRDLSLPRLIDLLKWGAKQPLLQCFPLQHRVVAVDRLIVLADVAARATKSMGHCLVRSLLLFWLLKARDEAIEFFIGVRKESALITGHAWLEREGRVIADDLTVTSRFVPVLRCH